MSEVRPISADDVVEAYESNDRAIAMLHMHKNPLEHANADLQLKFQEIANYRVGGHIRRFLSEGRTTQENGFGLVLLMHLKEKRELLMDGLGLTLDEYDNVNDVLNGEGDDTMMWYTVAPYLFDTLKSKGLDDTKALALTLAYANVQGHANNADHVLLKGLEFIDGWNVRAYTLAAGGQGKTHEVTRRFAQWLVESGAIDATKFDKKKPE